MQVGGRGGGCCQKAFEHAQLDAIIRDVITAAQQLDGLRLRRHLVPIQMVPLIPQIILIRGSLHKHND